MRQDVEEELLCGAEVTPQCPKRSQRRLPCVNGRVGFSVLNEVYHAVMAERTLDTPHLTILYEEERRDAVDIELRADPSIVRDVNRGEGDVLTETVGGLHDSQKLVLKPYAVDTPGSPELEESLGVGSKEGVDVGGVEILRHQSRGRPSIHRMQLTEEEERDSACKDRHRHTVVTEWRAMMD